MPFDVSFKPRGFDELADFFQAFPRHLRGIVAEAASDDLIGTPSRGLKHYPAYRHITRKSAYGKTFQSVRQQRFVMASIRSGRIEPGYPHRTGNYQRSWVRQGSGVSSRIEGLTPHDNWPDPLAKKIGWREPMEIIMSNMTHAQQAAERAVAAYLAEKGYS
jgi:hypothetical protein